MKTRHSSFPLATPHRRDLIAGLCGSALVLAGAFPALADNFIPTAPKPNATGKTGRTKKKATGRKLTPKQKRAVRKLAGLAALERYGLNEFGKAQQIVVRITIDIGRSIDRMNAKMDKVAATGIPKLPATEPGKSAAARFNATIAKAHKEAQAAKVDPRIRQEFVKAGNNAKATVNALRSKVKAEKKKARAQIDDVVWKVMQKDYEEEQARKKKLFIKFAVGLAKTMQKWRTEARQKLEADQRELARIDKLIAEEKRNIAKFRRNLAKLSKGADSDWWRKNYLDQIKSSEKFIKDMREHRKYWQREVNKRLAEVKKLDKSAAEFATAALQLALR